MAFVQIDTWQASPAPRHAAFPLPAWLDTTTRRIGAGAISIAIIAAAISLVMAGKLPEAAQPPQQAIATFDVGMPGAQPEAQRELARATPPEASAPPPVAPAPSEWRMVRIAAAAAPAADRAAPTGSQSGSASDAPFDPYAGAAPRRSSASGNTRGQSDSSIGGVRLSRQNLAELRARFLARHPAARGTAILHVDLSGDGIVTAASVTQTSLPANQASDLATLAVGIVMAESLERPGQIDLPVMSF